MVSDNDNRFLASGDILISNNCEKFIINLFFKIHF